METDGRSNSVSPAKPDADSFEKEAKDQIAFDIKLGHTGEKWKTAIVFEYCFTAAHTIIDTLI